MTWQEEYGRWMTYEDMTAWENHDMTNKSSILMTWHDWDLEHQMTHPVVICGLYYLKESLKPLHEPTHLAGS